MEPAVQSKPKPVTVRVMQLRDWGPFDDKTVEAVAVIRRLPVTVIDFYKGRAA